MAQFTSGSTPSSHNEHCRRKTLADFIELPGIYPAGRLDFDSEGLLLLTDDGPLQHRLCDPKFAHKRTYWVQVEGEITEEALDNLRRGVQVQDYVTRPAQAIRISAPPIAGRIPPIRTRLAIPTSWLQLILTEGRNRQVRRMTAATGFPTLRLVRSAIGNLRIDGLEPGQWRSLTAEEISNLKRR